MLAVVCAIACALVPSGAFADLAPGRVIPLPAGRWSWSAGYGVAGPMWASGHHTGQDFSAAAGTPILAAADGVVVFTGDGGPYGNLTQIQHDPSTQTWYAHQSQILVSVGTHVSAGQVIGAVGATGNTTGPHLHFEVRINGSHTDPRAWLEGAPSVSVDTSGFDPALASQLRGELADAEATQQRAAQRVEEINAELAVLKKQNKKIYRAAETARLLLIRQIRNVYTMGIDPQWLINIEAFDAGDWRTFADQNVIAQYTSNARSNEFDDALAAVQKAKKHEETISSLASQAQQVLTEATSKMTSLQAKLAQAGGLALAGSQFDGVLPPGGTAAAQRAVKFALSQVGHDYNSNGGTGPTYGCNGFSWRAWHEAGSQWPLATANEQATNRRWVHEVPTGQEQVGDLIFWRMNNGTDQPGRIDHVGIVVNPGQGLFVHASSPRTGVEINNYKSSSYYRSVAMFGRVVR